MMQLAARMSLSWILMRQRKARTIAKKRKMRRKASRGTSLRKRPKGDATCATEWCTFFQGARISRQAKFDKPAGKPAFPKRPCKIPGSESVCI